MRRHALWVVPIALLAGCGDGTGSVPPLAPVRSVPEPILAPERDDTDVRELAPAVYGVVVTEFDDPLPGVDVLAAGEQIGRTNLHGEFCVFPAPGAHVSFARAGFQTHDVEHDGSHDAEMLVRLRHIDEQVEPFRSLMFATNTWGYGVPGVRIELSDREGKRLFAEGISRADGSFLYERPDDFEAPFFARMTGPRPDQVRNWDQSVPHGSYAFVANTDDRLTIHVRPLARATYGEGLSTGFLCSPGPAHDGCVRGPLPVTGEWVRHTSGMQRPSAIAVWARGTERATMRTYTELGAELDVELPAETRSAPLWFDAQGAVGGAEIALRVDPPFHGAVVSSAGVDIEQVEDSGTLDVPLVATEGLLRTPRLDLEDDVTVSLRSLDRDRDLRVLAPLPAIGAGATNARVRPLRVVAGTARLTIRVEGEADAPPAAVVVRRRGGCFVRMQRVEVGDAFEIDGLSAGAFVVYVAPVREDGGSRTASGVAMVLSSKHGIRHVVIEPGSATEHTVHWAPSSGPRARTTIRER